MQGRGEATQGRGEATQGREEAMQGRAPPKPRPRQEAAGTA